MTEKQLTSRDFAADPLKVKQLVKKNVVVVTNRGEPELAILTYREYRALKASHPLTALEALGDEAGADIDFDAPVSRELFTPLVL
jgi:PHD/YefM family antitoxin component YafN of YafNO toxin-antitoxin module